MCGSGLWGQLLGWLISRASLDTPQIIVQSSRPLSHPLATSHLGHPTGSPLKSPQNYCAPPTSRVARDHRPLQNNALSRNMTTHMLCKAILDLVEAECTEQSTEEGKQQSRVKKEVDTNHPSCVHRSHLTCVSAASIHVLTL